VFDNSKISDHFAIIPTLQTPKHLNEAEQKLYDMVVRRFLAVFYPAAQYLQTTRITRVAEHHFRTDGKVLQEPGWLAVYGREGEETETLPPIAQGEKAPVREIAAKANETRPPPRYTEATLLSAMEGAGKLVEDDELRAAMEAKGLGTPATRAAIIEGLIREEYVNREGRELVPTPKAFSLLFALHMLHIVELASPELTGEWEHKLKLIEAGKLTREEFMKQISALVKKVVTIIKTGEIPDVVYATVPAPCPRCGGVVQENYRKFQCQKCDFAIWKVTSGREWSPEEIAELITRRSVGPLTGFRSRQGKPFSAVLKLNDELKVEFDFGQASGEGEASARLQRPGAAGRVPQVRRARLRAWDGLYVREGGRPAAQLRLPFRPHDPAAAHRARPDEEAARHGAHRPAERVRVEKGPSLQGIPGEAARRQDRVRIPAAAFQGEGRGGEGKTYTSRFRTPSAFDSMNARRGSTSSPISLVKISSAAMPSSICTLSRRRALVSMVVSHSCSGFISPSPL
jgi:Zn finger protein HypA/HybF involved in hydrogenase expression